MMFDEPLVRLLVVLVALAAGIAVGRWSRAGGGRARDVVDPSPLPPGVHLFTGERCASCDPVRRLLAGEGPVHEVVWEVDPSTFTAAGVHAVPTVVVVGPGGEVLGAWRGRPPIRRLRRAVARLRASRESE